MNPNNQNQHPGHEPQPVQPPQSPQPTPQYKEGDIIQAGQPLPTVSPELSKFRMRDIVLTLGIVFVVGALITVFILFVSAPGRERANIEKNGIEATAISTGESRLVKTRLSSRNSIEKLNAYYTFTAQDGKEYRVLGEKDYEEESNVKEGMKATIRYLADKPTEPEFITEE